MGNIRDPRSGGRVFGYSERHLQAVWFDPRWRPVILKTHDGEDVTVESPGNWNLEAGPDFTGAAFKVGPGQRRITGDVEIHIFPAGWKQHGHDRDPRYRNVRLHITYYEGIVPPDLLPPGSLQVALRPALRADPGFAFDHIDISAYPYAGRAGDPPCRRLLSAWPVEQRAAFLESAGHARLKKKSDRLHAAIVERGFDQVLYETIMGALGYQCNKVPFAKLAAIVPLDRLREVAGGQELRMFAILAGASGLLPAAIRDPWDEPTRRYVRTIWDAWWKVQSQFPDRIAAHEWRLRGIRPANHPLRRLVAVAHLLASGRGGLDLLESWIAGEPRRLAQRIEASLCVSRDSYWATRYSLGGRKASGSCSIVGRDRSELIALNVVIPLAAAIGCAPEQVAALLHALGPEPDNQIIRQTAFYLLGRDYPSRLLANAARRQGLQQIFHDYCLNDRSRCMTCSLPGKLAAMAPVNPAGSLA